MPLVCKAFGDIITFTRASSATYFDSAGVLQTATTDTPRFDYNPATLAARGFLIEEARTNLLTYSETFNTTPDWNPTRTSVSADAAVAPDGNTTADALVIDTTPLTNHNIGQNESVTSGTTYTISVFAKANQITQINLRFSAQFPAGNTFFDLSAGTLTNNGTVVASSITPVGNGWYRCTFTQTANATGTAAVQIFLAVANSITIATANGTDNVLIWGAQLEAGAFATSYIPTTTASATRSADVASVNTLSPWYSATEGTIYFEAQFYNAPNVAASNIGALSNGTNSNRVALGAATNFSGNINSNVSSGGVGQANPYVGSLSTIGPHKAAATYANNSFNIAVNGTLGVEDTSGVVPVGVNTLVLGRAANGAGATNGWLRRATYYPRKLSNAELQAITS